MNPFRFTQIGNRSSANASGRFQELKEDALERISHGPGAALVATLCATSATAAFMAHDFHELSPYVLIGNPLTLAIIEFFAVPCALIGAALYPLGLDGFVWRWLEMGINLVCWLAGLIANAPGASLHVKSFAPWAIVFFTLAVLSAVLWRTWTLRATAIPLVMIGLVGAVSAPRFDIAVAPTGDAAAVRRPSGDLGLLGKRPGAFAAEQWLRADADARLVSEARDAGECDALGCIATAVDGRVVALLTAPGALFEDCERASVIITPLHAPEGCAAPIVIDRDTLARTGAVTLRLLKDGGVEWTTARATDEDRPWSPRSSWSQPRRMDEEAHFNDDDAPLE